jgi:CheY-like chemotaxis protein
VVWSVLLVEDSPDIRHVVAFALERDKRFSVAACTCGAEAVRLAGGTAGFDFVLLDYLLPDMTNADCIRGLRSRSATRNAKLVLITAYVPRAGTGAYYDAGVDAVILKPFEILTLGDQLAALIAPADRVPPIHPRADQHAPSSGQQHAAPDRSVG